MSMLESILKQVTQGDSLKQLSRKAGADEAATGAATSAALTALLGALAKNASSESGAAALDRALDRDHDGSVLDNLSGFLDKSDTADGDAILKHVLGGRRQSLERGVGKSTGLSSGAVGKIMATLAPVVLAQLGRQKRSQGLDASSLGRMLGEERSNLQKVNPGGMGMLGKLLDSDGDGDFDLGDLAKGGGGLLGKLFGR